MLSIVVLNWNSGPFLRRCLASIEAQTSAEWELIAVDNGSTNDSLAVLEEFQQRGVITTLVRLETNVGYAEGMNVGLRRAMGDVILALNSDAVLAPGFVEVVNRDGAKVMGERPSVGLLAVPVFDWELSPTRDVLTNRLQAAGVTLVRRLTVCHWVDGVERSEALLGPSGAAQVISRRALDAAIAYSGFAFDPDYFAYAEDIDLYVRLQSLGFTCAPLTGTRLWHLGSASVGQAVRLSRKPQRLQAMSHLNRWRTWAKLGSGRIRIGMLPWMLLEDIIRLVVSPDRWWRLKQYVANYAALRAQKRRRYPVARLAFGGTMYSRSTWRALHGRSPVRYPSAPSALNPVNGTSHE
ncbi:MAG: glycosyltransferase [bacterium]